MGEDAASLISTTGSRKRASIQDDSRQGRVLKPRPEYSIGGMDQASPFISPPSIAPDHQAGYHPSAAMFGTTSQGQVFPPLASSPLVAPSPLFPSFGLEPLAGNVFSSSPAGFGLPARPAGAIGAAPAPLPTFGQSSSPSPFSGNPGPLQLNLAPSGMAPISQGQSSSSLAMAGQP